MMVVFKLLESVTTARYYSVCNVFMYMSTRVILTIESNNSMISLISDSAEYQLATKYDSFRGTDPLQ